MRIWSRSAAPFVCGCCGETWPADSPLLQFLLGPGKRTPTVLFRCRDCAGEPMPDSLPTRPARTDRRQLRLTQFDEDGIERPVSAGREPEPIGKHAADWQARYLGEK